MNLDKLPKLTPWKTLSRRLLLDRGKFLRVEEHAIELPDGSIIPDWTWVIGPDAVIVLPETVDGQFLCFHQTKYAVDGATLAPVGGHVDAGEDPLTAAKRELLEETGFEAETWVHLGDVVSEPNRGVGTRHLFLARGAVPKRERNADDLEEQVFVYLTRQELEEALFAGEFKVSSWAAVVAMVLQWLNRAEREAESKE